MFANLSTEPLSRSDKLSIYRYLYDSRTLEKVYQELLSQKLRLKRTIEGIDVTGDAETLRQVYDRMTIPAPLPIGDVEMIVNKL